MQLGFVTSDSVEQTKKPLDMLVKRFVSVNAPKGTNVELFRVSNCFAGILPDLRDDSAFSVGNDEFKCFIKRVCRLIIVRLSLRQ